MKSPRRFASAILSLALVWAAVPPQAHAQVARVALGEAGARPAVPAAGTGVQAGPSSALPLPVATLSASLTHSAAPAPAAASAFAAPALSAPGLAPARLSPIPDWAAAKPEGPKNAADSAKTPAAGRTGLLARLGSMLGRKAEAPKPAPAPSVESAKAAADANFDGAAAKSGETEGPSVAGTETRSSSRLARAAAALKSATTKPLVEADTFGGPTVKPMNFRQRVGYGLRWGLNMIGISAILNLTLKPLLEVFPWPQYLSDGALNGFGRVALLVSHGPNELVAALSNSPLAFMTMALPYAVVMEELTYRLLGMGGIFLLIAAIRPVTRGLASLLKEFPDAAGVVSLSSRMLGWGEKLSKLAFPIAVVASSLSFAMAHFAAWGVSPFVLATNFVMGFSLAHVAYRSRGLTAPVIAHLLFNLVIAGGVLVALSLSPAAAVTYQLIAGLIGVAALFYHWRAIRQENAARREFGGKALAALALVATSLGLFGGSASFDPLQAARDQGRPAVVLTQDAHGPAAPAAAQAAAVDSTAKVYAAEELVAKVKPAVVNVVVRMPGGMGTGSGFIVDPRGVFVTNAHVVGPTPAGGFVGVRVNGVPMELKAKVLAVNHDKDIAIVALPLRPDGKPWPTVPLATSIKEGEKVMAMGYPRGLPFTVTEGIVSGVGHRGNMYVSHVQTDAAINPGNSGGPLFNMKGEVLGVNTQIFTMSGGSEGLGFSISAPDVRAALNQLMTTGNIATAALGIIVNLSDPAAPESGVLVEYARWDSPAEKAGLRRNDLIVSVAGQPILAGGQEGAQAIAAIMAKSKPGDKVEIVVLRDDAPVTLELELGAKESAAGR